MASKEEIVARPGGRVYGRARTKSKQRRLMAAAEVKNFDSPDEVRPFEGKGQAKMVQLAGHAVGKGTFEPGWKWSANVKPIAGTDSCQVAHFGYVLSGTMRIFMDDGSEVEVVAGDVVAIPPGHDAEVPGEEPCVMVDFGEIGDYAKRD
jgi:mannose-6-phosphate isomerase-like protein (cupin superfamily)